MSYASALAIFIFVLTPLLLPLTISGVHAIAKWRRSLRTAVRTPVQRVVPSPLTNGEPT
jgi:hypothetical protein